MNGLFLKKKRNTNTSILKNSVSVFYLLYKGKRVQLIDVDKKLHQQTASSSGGCFSSQLEVQTADFGHTEDAWHGRLLCICPFSIVSLRGQFKTQPHPHWSPLRVHF